MRISNYVPKIIFFSLNLKLSYSFSLSNWRTDHFLSSLCNVRIQHKAIKLIEFKKNFIIIYLLKIIKDIYITANNKYFCLENIKQHDNLNF